MNGDAILKQLLGRKREKSSVRRPFTRSRKEDFSQPASGAALNGKPRGQVAHPESENITGSLPANRRHATNALPASLPNDSGGVIESGHASIIVGTDDGLIELVKDFDTGEMVPRYSYHKEPKPCAGCGEPGCYHDHKYGWRVCIGCESEEVEHVASI